MLCIMVLDATDNPSWVPAIVTKVYRTLSLNVEAVPKGSTQRRYVALLRPRFLAKEDHDPDNKPDITEEMKLQQPGPTTVPRRRQRKSFLPDKYSRDNHRKSEKKLKRPNVNLS